MKKMKFLLAAIMVASISNLGWTQWTITGSNAYNTNYNSTPAGKIGIGLVPIANTSTLNTSILQLKGISGYQPGSYTNLIPIFTISSDNVASTMNFGLSNSDGAFINTGNTTLSLFSSVGVDIRNSPGGIAGNLTVGTVSIGNILKIGNVSTPSGYKLYVETGILTEKLKVAVKTTSNWSDYVFNQNYKLWSLQEVEAYINKNKHLPGVPSAEEVVEEGIDVATMDAKLLEKIEELTLYMIQMQKENEALRQRVQILENK